MISVLRGDDADLLGATTEYSFSKQLHFTDGPPVGVGVDQVYHDNRQRLQTVYRYAGESAVILRQSLGNPRVKLMRVGTRLGKAAIAARQGGPLFVTLAHLLHRQGEQEAQRAWEIRLM